MLDEKDLQAIAQLLSKQREDIMNDVDVKLSRQKDDIMQAVDERLGNMSRTFDEKLDNMSQAFDEKLGNMSQAFDEKLGNMSQAFDEKLGNMSQTFDEKLGNMSQTFDEKLTRQKSGIIQEVIVLMESYFDPKFNLLSEKLDIFREKALTHDDISELSSRVDTLEVVAQLHDQKIQKLENALVS